MLVCSWLLLNVVLAAFYSSKLTASLTVKNKEPPFTSLAQLVHQDTYTWGIASGTAKSSILSVSYTGLLGTSYIELLGVSYIGLLGISSATDKSSTLPRVQTGVPLSVLVTHWDNWHRLGHTALM